MIHFVVNNAEELRRTIDGVGAPSMVKATTSILVVNMLGPVVHKCGPLITSSRISSNAILKEVTVNRINSIFGISYRVLKLVGSSISSRQ